MTDSIIFDLDGTLWNATEAICKTWNIVLKDYPDIREPITMKELESCMGMLLDDISRKLFPKESPKLQKELIDKCCNLEVEYLAEHGGNLFPYEEETLKYLSKKYKLFIVSNCQSGYIESYFDGHGFNKYFTDIECAGNTGLEKGENNKLIIKRNGLKCPVYVGDTQSDLDSARIAEIPFVYASYGFGAVKEYDYIIKSFEELQTLF
jgi:HAD hydrolase, family IA, variant 1